jgi:hypothetical protein
MKKLFLILPAIALCMGASLMSFEVRAQMTGGDLPLTAPNCTISPIDHPGIKPPVKKPGVPPLDDDFEIPNPGPKVTDCLMCYEGGADGTISPDECLAACNWSGGNTLPPKKDGKDDNENGVNDLVEDDIKALCCAAQFPDGKPDNSPDKCSTGCDVTGAGGVKGGHIEPTVDECKKLLPKRKKFITDLHVEEVVDQE